MSHCRDDQLKKVTILDIAPGFCTGWTDAMTLSTWEINFSIFKEPRSNSVRTHEILVKVYEDPSE